MKPHIEEAWRALRLADRDIKVFDILVEIDHQLALHRTLSPQALRA